MAAFDWRRHAGSNVALCKHSNEGSTASDTSPHERLNGMLHVKKSVTINRPRAEIYQFWRRLENLPRFMVHLESVTSGSGRRSHWVAAAPFGRVEWDAEIISDVPNEMIAWRSLQGSDVANEGSVRFAAAPGDRGTEVRVEFLYEAPAGKLGAAIAKLFGEEPQQQLTDDLRRLKQVLETGEVVRSDGSPEGAGQGATQQRVAQPSAAGGIS
jgi:uncharacterized membrane protein